MECMHKYTHCGTLCSLIQQTEMYTAVYTHPDDAYSEPDATRNTAEGLNPDDAYDATLERQSGEYTPYYILKGEAYVIEMRLH